MRHYPGPRRLYNLNTFKNNSRDFKFQEDRGESKDISIFILLLGITIKNNKEKNPALVKLKDICNPESQHLKRENP